MIMLFRCSSPNLIEKGSVYRKQLIMDFDKRNLWFKFVPQYDYGKCYNLNHKFRILFINLISNVWHETEANKDFRIKISRKKIAQINRSRRVFITEINFDLSKHLFIFLHLTDLIKKVIYFKPQHYIKTKIFFDRLQSDTSDIKAIKIHSNQIESNYKSDSAKWEA